MKMIHVVQGGRGSYSDHYEWEVRAFVSAARANAFCTKLGTLAEIINKKSSAGKKKTSFEAGWYSKTNEEKDQILKELNDELTSMEEFKTLAELDPEHWEKSIGIWEDDTEYAVVAVPLDEEP